MKYISLLVVVLMATNVQAQEEDYYSYDQIVKELSETNKTSTTRAPKVLKDPFSSVLIHGGVSFVNSYISLSPSSASDPLTGFHAGIEATIGIDLFSRHWKAEGSIRSFGRQEIKDNELSLREFDLKIVHQDYITNGIFYRAGGGMAARYLKFTQPKKDEVTTLAAGDLFETTEHTTPSSIIFLGIGGKLGRKFSVAAEISYRGALIDETIDKSAFDAALRLDAHF
tara:strand:+ start:556 stop:1233 length:678 start_codon:yes stop_codon:yes gene_type:complete